jgi:ABC-2 type transport system permease protein
VVRKTQFPRLVIPLATVLTSLLNLAVNLIAVLVFLVAFGVSPAWTWLGFPLLLLVLVVFTAAVSMIVSALFPRFRDVAIIWSVLSTVLFYASPVLYPIDKVPGGLRDVFMLNPLAPLLELARKWIIDPSAPGPVAVAGGSPRLVAPVAIYLAICALALWLFEREAPHVAEEL